MAIETGRYYPGIIENQKITPGEILQEIGELPMLHFACISIQDHQTSALPLLWRMLGDQFRGKVVVKIGCPHYFVGYPELILTKL
jgi:hypothetical protein